MGYYHNIIITTSMLVPDVAMTVDLPGTGRLVDRRRARCGHGGSQPPCSGDIRRVLRTGRLKWLGTFHGPRWYSATVMNSLLMSMILYGN